MNCKVENDINDISLFINSILDLEIKHNKRLLKLFFMEINGEHGINEYFE